jgi:hypothetical protein
METPKPMQGTWTLTAPKASAGMNGSAWCRRGNAMEMLRSFTLKLELFAGTDVRDAANDMCQLADRIGVRCEANFNGVKLWARPGDNPLRLVESYHTELAKPAMHYKIAQA